MTKAERTKQMIIDRSAEIFNTKGIAATSMSDIMEATKLAKGSLYVHFENKDQLAHAVVDHNLKAAQQKVQLAMDRHQGPKGKLIALITAFGDTRHPAVPGGCPMLNFGCEADDTDPIVRQKVAKMLSSTQQLIASLVESGIAAKEFDKTWNAKEFGTKALAMLEGAILLSRVSGRPDALQLIVSLLTKEIEERSK